jgi:membrane fusion protein (multidrug efflux system)
MEEEAAVPKKRGRKKIALLLIVILIALGGVALHFFLQYKEAHVSTDDAFIDGRVHAIASKIPGTVKALHMKDNQLVRKKDLLLEIDPVDYDVRVREARAGVETESAKVSEIRNRIETARRQIRETQAGLEAARANYELQEANLRQAEVDFRRADSLVKREVIARQQFDRARTAYEVALAQVKAASDQIRQIEASLETQESVVRQAESQLPTQYAQIRQKEATLKAAELSLDYTRVYAPSDGYITKRSVEVGNQVQAGQPLMAVVPLGQEEIWVTANYKETQLKRVRPGQKVRIEVDTYPDRVFEGRVESIMAGTGSAFSLFPPENATGNFVKVVQRIPVKIVLSKDTDPRHLLRIGMSVVPTILVEP